MNIIENKPSESVNYSITFIFFRYTYIKKSLYLYSKNNLISDVIVDFRCMVYLFTTNF